MREEIIKTEGGMVWMKFHLSPSERLRRFWRLLPRFWDGNWDTYGPLDEIWDTFVSNLKEGILGYWIGCQPDKEIGGYESVRELFEDNYHEDPIYKTEVSNGTMTDSILELPDEWHPNWRRWCKDNCDSIGQCGWNRENCPHTDFKLKSYQSSTSTANLEEKG